MKTSEAILEIGHCVAVIMHNMCRSVNAVVKTSPWFCMAAVVTASVAVSAVKMMQARAERDRACKQVVLLRQQVNNLSCALEAREEAAR